MKRILNKKKISDKFLRVTLYSIFLVILSFATFPYILMNIQHIAGHGKTWILIPLSANMKKKQFCNF